jgi:hypothetical protein
MRRYLSIHTEDPSIMLFGFVFRSNKIRTSNLSEIYFQEHFQENRSNQREFITFGFIVCPRQQ